MADLSASTTLRPVTPTAAVLVDVVEDVEAEEALNVVDVVVAVAVDVVGSTTVDVVVVAAAVDVVAAPTAEALATSRERSRPLLKLPRALPQGMPAAQ